MSDTLKALFLKQAVGRILSLVNAGILRRRAAQLHTSLRASLNAGLPSDAAASFWQDYEAARSRNSVVASSWSSSFQSDPASRIRQDRQGFATVSGLPTVNSNTC